MGLDSCVLPTRHDGISIVQSTDLYPCVVVVTVTFTLYMYMYMVHDNLYMYMYVCRDVHVFVLKVSVAL